MSAPTVRPLDHYCGLCRYALERFRVAGEPDRFEHTHSAESWAGPAHEPQPVPLAELTLVHMVCDVCSAPDPQWMYRFVNVMYVSGRGVEDMGEWWAICELCTRGIEVRDVELLLGRAHRPFIERGQPVSRVREVLGPIYQQLLANAWERMPARVAR